jgi:alpha-ketoglutarate-dependent taurine dioxygenase
VIVHPAGVFDNQARAYEHIVVEELAAAMGAEVKGVDLAAVADEQFAEIEHALFRHKMIFFRDQRIIHADHESFSLRFGDFADDAYATHPAPTPATPLSRCFSGPC